MAHNEVNVPSALVARVGMACTYSSKVNKEEVIRWILETCSPTCPLTHPMLTTNDSIDM